MFDRILNKIFGAKDTDSRPLVTKRFIYRPSKKLLVLPRPWGGKDFWFKKIENNGSAVLEYTFSRNIVCADAEKVLANFQTTADQIERDIESLASNFQEIEIIGISLSCVTALLIANRNNKITAVTLVLPGSDLASALWTSIRGENLRIEYQRQGLGLSDLEQKWQPIAPINNIGNLAGKKIKVVLSKADRLIPFWSGKRLADALIAKNYDVTIDQNSFLGHYLTFLNFIRKES